MRRLLSLFLLIALLAGCSAAPDLPAGTPLPSQTDATQRARCHRRAWRQ